MRRFALLCGVAVFVLSVVPVWAAGKKPMPANGGNSITVIQEDGSAVTIDMDPADAELSGANTDQAPAPQQFDMPVKTAPGKEAKPAAAAPVSAVKKEAVTPAQSETEAPPKSEEAKEPVTKPATKKASPKVKAKPAAKSAKTKSKAKGKSKTTSAQSETAQQTVVKNLAPGAEITQRDAEMIALDRAPASSGYSTQRHTFEGKPVYVVTFKTEDGPYDVLVETTSGKILSAGASGAPASAPTQPGHLPGGWEPYKPRSVGTPDNK